MAIRVSSRRQRGLERLSLLDPGEGFGFLLRTSLIKAQAARSFELAPKRYSGNGAPSSIGPIHLTGLSVEFREPDTIVTRLTGYDDRPLPDVGFTVIITDTIQLNNVATVDPGEIAKFYGTGQFTGFMDAFYDAVVTPPITGQWIDVLPTLFTQNGTVTLEYEYTVVPAPAGAAAMLGLGLITARRRHR